MSPEDWDRVKELFEAALELDPGQRASFLAANSLRDNSRQGRTPSEKGPALEQPQIALLPSPSHLGSSAWRMPEKHLPLIN